MTMTVSDNVLTFSDRLSYFLMMLDRSRSPDSVRLLCEAAPSFGVTAEQCLGQSGVLPFDLYNSDTRLTTAQEMDVIANFLRYAPKRAGLGIEVGLRYTPQVFGVWGYAILSAPDLRTGLSTAINFIGLSYMLAEMSLQKGPEISLAYFDTSYIPDEIRRFVLERQLTVMRNFGMATGLNSLVDHIEFMTTETDTDFAAVIEQELGYRVQTGRDVNAIIMPSALLDLPFPAHDPQVMQKCLEQCKKQLQDGVADETNWTEKVRDVVFQELNNKPDITLIAARLDVTERTLRRRLTAEGSSFRDILGDVRLSMGRKLLETTGLGVAAVSWRVGYSESSAFIRAFTKKYGFSPGSVSGA